MDPSRLQFGDYLQSIDGLPDSNRNRNCHDLIKISVSHSGHVKDTVYKNS